MTYILTNIIFFLYFIGLSMTGSKAYSQLDFSGVDYIIKKIQLTSFQADTFRIFSYGAIGNGTSDSRTAIISAINACYEKGGGVVLIPDGIFFCKGPVSLKSNVNLHLSAGATLLFSAEPDDYLPVVLTRWEGLDFYNYSPMIYTEGQENIAITGQGLIDGNSEKIWMSFRKLQTEAQNRARMYCDQERPVKERIFGKDAYLRPSFIQFMNCKRILVEDVTLIKSPFWILHPVYSSNIIIRNVKLNSLVINNDGIDFDSSEYGLVEECTFNTGDDAVVFKSGRDRDGWRVNKPTKNIVIRNCTAPRVLSGIAFGSEMSGGIENIYIENLRLGKVKGEAIQFKANKDRGGYIRNVFIRNIEADTVGGHLLYFTNSYHSYRGGNAPSEFYNICLENIRCSQANYVMQLQGLEEKPLHDISIEKVIVGTAKNIFDKKEFYKNINLKGFQVSGNRIVLTK